MKYLSVFCLNAGKYRPEKLQIWTFFTQFTPLLNKLKMQFLITGNHLNAFDFVKYSFSKFSYQVIRKSGTSLNGIARGQLNLKDFS